MPLMEHKSSLSFEDLDVIISMPENVVATILNCLPIHDAVRTSILSRNWRFKWTLVTKVLVDEISRYFDGIGPSAKYCYDGNYLTRLFHNLKGPVTKFTFTVSKYMTLDPQDITNWVLFLSGNGIKEITIINEYETPTELPSHLASCKELKHLKLHKCRLHSLPANLLILELEQVTWENHSCIARCPLLETLKISNRNAVAMGKMELVDLAQLGNLTTLYMPLCMLHNITAITSPILFQLGVYLPKLQELGLYFHNTTFGEDEAADTKWVSTAFPCLKTLTLDLVDFGNHSMLSCVVGMVRCSPYLQSLKITATCTKKPWSFSSMLKYNTILGQLQKLQLRHVVFTSFICTETAEKLVKYLLACSPLLKKIVIYTRSPYDLTFSVKLLMLPRVSPEAQVEFY